MNIRQVVRLIAFIVLLIAGCMALPLAVALFHGDARSAWAFGVTMGLGIGACLPAIIGLRREKRDFLSTRSSFLLVTGGWLAAALFGSLPFMLSGEIPAFADALFETMSGLTTTGASILTNIESHPPAILFWRSFTHWLGGMGIVVLAVAILPLLGVGGLQLIQAEAPGPTVDKITPRIAETAKIVWLIYTVFTIVETVLLMCGGLNLFDALTHTFATMATGGFSTKNVSVGHFDSAYVDGVVTVFMLLAGINFILHYRLLTGRFRDVFRNFELLVYLSIFAAATLLITFSLYGDTYAHFSTSVRYAAFQSAAILTTTGFVTADFEKWPALAQGALFLLMFVGGCSGSTGGGIKVIRIMILFKQGIHEMKYLLHPRGIFTLKVNQQVIRKNIGYGVAGFFFLYMLTLAVVTLVMALAGQDLVTSFTCALTTVGNIGPGFGAIGPAENYAYLPGTVKLVLSLAMLAGRLELYTVLILFTPMFWRK